MTNNKKHNSTHNYTLLIILILAAAVRLYKIENPLYDWNAWRQTETAAIAMNYYQDHLPLFYPEIDWVGEHGHAEMEFPFFPYLISWIYYFTTPWDGWGRILSVLVSLGIVFLLYDIGKNLSSPLLGLFAAAFFAASPLAIYYGRTFLPDMTMVFFSTLSVALLLRWKPKTTLWFYASAIALAMGVIMKPPCLMVTFPLLWILYQRGGPQFLRTIHFWAGLVIVFLPTVIWYSHAHSFYAETQASFIRHFKDTTLMEYIAKNIHWDNWHVILTERISKTILAYVGLIPLAIGLFRLYFPNPERMLLSFWLLATFIFYAVIAAHHKGHDYYSLLPIIPLSLLCAYGCEWLYIKLPNMMKPTVWVMPLSVGVLGFYGLLQFDAYRQWYPYYQDAHALKQHIPEDALILVMDEVAHTPEFFYSIDRNGWHRFREPIDNINDSQWLEEHRQKGADFYVGLNEGSGNHPLHYLQTHPMGQYIYTHYEIESIGTRYFIANLNKPRSEDETKQILDHYVIDKPAVIQAEQLLTGNTKLIDDPQADRSSAILIETGETAGIMTYGPYFHFPPGTYDFTFRLRSAQQNSTGSLEIGLRYGDDFLQSKRITLPKDLGNEYQDFKVTLSIKDDVPLETRVAAGPHTSAIMDTVTIQHKQPGSEDFLFGQTVTHIVQESDKILKLSNKGSLFTLENKPVGQITNGIDHVKLVQWDPFSGFIWLDDQGTCFDGVRTELLQLNGLQDDELPVSLSRNSGVLAVITNQYRVIVWQQMDTQFHDLPKTETLPRDIAVTTNSHIYILYGSGNLITISEHAPNYSIPNFGADVCRRLIPVEGGFYVVDSLGAIHNTEGIPPVRSPYYKMEDWIIDAERTPNGQWAYLTKEGNVLTFEE